MRFQPVTKIFQYLYTPFSTVAVEKPEKKPTGFIAIRGILQRIITEQRK